MSKYDIEIFPYEEETHEESKEVDGHLLLIPQGLSPELLAIIQDYFTS